jgi:hypothetical protein
MAGYTKLFNSILASTVWREPIETRIVWITLLAMADKYGMAEGSVPGLADFARIPVEATREALARLMAPDPDSRSKESEGRRVEEVDGGWRIVNHAKYRAKMGLDDRREYNRLKQAQYRARVAAAALPSCQTMSLTVNHREHCVDNAEAKAEVHKNVRTVSAQPDGFAAFWAVWPNRKSKQAALKAWLKLKPDAAMVSRLLAAVEIQKGWSTWTKDGGQYIPHASTWLNNQRWEDEPAHVDDLHYVPSVEASKATLERERREREELSRKVTDDDDAF